MTPHRGFFSFRKNDYLAGAVGDGDGDGDVDADGDGDAEGIITSVPW
jgi:hypothetical protein